MNGTSKDFQEFIINRQSDTEKVLKDYQVSNLIYSQSQRKKKIIQSKTKILKYHLIIIIMVQVKIFGIFMIFHMTIIKINLLKKK